MSVQNVPFVCIPCAMLGLLLQACTPNTGTDPVESQTTSDFRQTLTAEVVGQAPEASRGTRSVVILEPREPLNVPLPTEPVEMDQFGRDFIPRLIVVRAGQQVLFKNSEDELHTVHVKDGEGLSLFNVAMPIQGGEHDHTFDDAGDYAVSCNAHQEMHATIVVVESPYAVVADRDGTFTLSEMPPGSYEVTLRQGDRQHKQFVEIVAGRNELQLDFPSAS
jgi:plastocyanin